METLRSDFLIHWTGKDIQRDAQTDDERRDQYVDRLRNTLRDGLWMNPIDLELYDPATKNIEPIPDWGATCFTEIKLSQTKKHTEDYGCLGFGFNRAFVMERSGGPVFYIAATEQGALSRHFAKLYKVLMFLKNKIAEDQRGSGIKEFLESSGLDDVLVNDEWITEPHRGQFTNIISCYELA